MSEISLESARTSSYAPRRSLTRFNAERTEAAIVIADAIKDIGSIIPSKSLVDDGNGLFATYFIAGSKAEA